MKKTLYTLTAATMIASALCGCKKTNSESSANEEVMQTVATEAEGEVATTPQATGQKPIQISEQGSISTDYVAGQEARVSFDRFPASFGEWQVAQAQLGNSLAGTVALELMAMQLYYYDQEEGEKAIMACNTDSDGKSLIRIIGQKFKQSLAGKGDDYVQPYLVASYLEGATPENAYHPTLPYEIVVRMHPQNKPQEGSYSFTGINYYLQINCNGADTNWRGIEVAELKGEPYYRVFNNASIAVGVKQIAYKSQPEDFDELH